MSVPLIVLERPESWSLQIPGVEVVSARQYLSDASLAARRAARVYNLCRSYRYQSVGYYVSLLAEARGHRPVPDVGTIQDLKSRSLVRFVSEDLDTTLQRSLAPIQSDRFTLSVYFGRNMAARHRKLALQLFNLFPSPLLRAQMVHQGDRWQLSSLRAIAAREIPGEHRAFVEEAAREHFARRPTRRAVPKAARWEMAVLVDPQEKIPPSGERALRRFQKAAEKIGFAVQTIGKDDAGRLAEFDGLFLRETTRVDHHTYRMARRARTEGLVVIDDPDSILRCANKVFLAELLERHRIPTPRTVIVTRDNVDAARDEIGLPAILKLPDGSFSRTVVRADDAESFRRHAESFLESSDLVVAQEFLPTDFDWRVGILDRKILYACRYGMAKGHWQIAQHQESGGVRWGAVEPVALADVPREVLDVALGSANLVGDGLYGVDVKVVAEGAKRKTRHRAVVIEINDNPNLDADCEDAILGAELWERLARVFLERIERLRAGTGTGVGAGIGAGT